MCACISDGNKAGIEPDEQRHTENRTSAQQTAERSMGAVYSIVWNKSWNMSGCVNDVLVLQVDLNDNVKLFSPPANSSSVNIIVLPTSANASCTIGSNKFVYLPSAYREELATTDLGCEKNNCWQYDDGSLIAYNPDSDMPAGDETWIKKSNSKYAYYKISNTSSSPDTKPIFIMQGSAKIKYDAETMVLTVKTIVRKNDSSDQEAEVVYTITCLGKKTLTIPATIRATNGLAKATLPMQEIGNNRIAVIDAINLPYCKVSASINDDTAVDIIAAQPAPPHQTGLALRVDWQEDVHISNCNARSTNVTIIGLNSDGSLRRVYDKEMPSSGDVNLLFLPVANVNAGCVIGNSTYMVDTTTFDNRTVAANMGCYAKNCWRYRDDEPMAHYVSNYSASDTPSQGEKWIKKTGNKYVFHLVQ